MKTFLAVILVAGSATALPQAISARASGPAEGFFDLSNFIFSGSRMSIEETYRFDVEETLSGASTYCSWSTSSAPDFQRFDYVPCQDPSFSFSFVDVAPGNSVPGWSLQITRSTPGGPTNETACQLYPKGDAVRTSDPNPNWEFTYLNVSENQVLPWKPKGKDECIYGPSG